MAKSKRVSVSTAKLADAAASVTTATQGVQTAIQQAKTELSCQ